MLNHKKLNNIYVAEDVRSSRFVVDLKNKLEDEIIKKEEKIKLDFIKNRFYEIFKTGKNNFRIIKAKPGLFFNKFFQAKNGKRPPKPAKNISRANNYSNLIKSGIKKLFIFEFIFFAFKFIGRFLIFFYRFFHKLGWLALFLARFAYFALISLLKPLSVLKHIFSFIPKKKHSYPLPAKNQNKNKILASCRIKLRPKVLSFALVLVILVLPLKALTYYKSFDIAGQGEAIIGAGSLATADFISGINFAKDLDFGSAVQNFNKAGSNFLKAKEETDKINDILFILASIAPNENWRLASESRHILSAGEKASRLADSLSVAINFLLNGDNGNLKEKIARLSDYLHTAIISSSDLRMGLENINSNNIPEDYRDQFILVRNRSVLLDESLLEFEDLLNNLSIFLGNFANKRYLLIFQNNTELRATGGFIGSYALLDFANGKIKNIEVPAGGSYDTEGGLSVLIKAPKPLQLVNPLWYFWDANWWPDWPTSAKKLMWFYDKSGGPTVDGVISFTPNVFADFLDIFGPIDMSEAYGVILTADNLIDNLQKIVEKNNIDQSSFSTSTPPLLSPANSAEIAGQEASASTDELAAEPPSKITNFPAEINYHKPKKIIGDLLLKLINNPPDIANGNNLVSLINLFGKNVKTKQILFYFTDNELQEKIEKYGWDGRIVHTKWDYLSVINTNIAGQKTDRVIEEEISHQAEIQVDGSIIDSVEIKRAHTGIKNELFTGVRNVDWMRIYVPLGAELIAADGFKKPDDIYFSQPEDFWQNDQDVFDQESSAQIDGASGINIYTEAGYTVFANWSMVDPGETAIIHLKYKLPFAIVKPEDSANGLIDKLISLVQPDKKQNIPYSLYVQKQSGAKAEKINSRLTLPANMKIIWHYPANQSEINVGPNGWRIEDSLDTDKYWALITELNIF